MRRLRDLLPGRAGSEPEISRSVSLEVVGAPRVIWPQAPGAVAMACPNCGADGDKALLLTVRSRAIGEPERDRRVLICPACDARLYDDQKPPDYAEAAMLERGRVPFYVQQGAGLSLITRPLARLAIAPGASYLEVGCGFGFGVDFAARARGWRAAGIDPAALSAIGREALDVPIALRYLDAADARPEHDVVMSSETIEHAPSPPDFVRILRVALRPGGVLVLTTPDGAALTPATPPGALVPLLSPGLHLVIQTEASLRRLLAASGFAHCAIERDGHSLVAIASDAPVALETDAAVVRRRYLDWLEARAASLPPGSDVFLGYAGRGFFDSVNDGDFSRAERLWRLLVPACAARYGIDLDAGDPLPAHASGAGLEALGQVAPLNLACLVYARAMQLLTAGVSRAVVEMRFRAAVRAAAVLRHALGEIAMEDGLTEHVGWTAEAEAALCPVRRDPVRAVASLRALPPAPGAGARAAFVWRGFVALAAAGHWPQAGTLADAERLFDTPLVSCPGADASLSRAMLDALCCLGLLDLHRGEHTRASVLLGRVRRAIGRPGADAAGLFWLAFDNEARAVAALSGDDAARARAQASLAEAGLDAAAMPPEVGVAWS